ncbi:MAG: multiheme c-type cytochrome [Thermoanaerobaculia bacterium]
MRRATLIAIAALMISGAAVSQQPKPPATTSMAPPAPAAATTTAPAPMAQPVAVPPTAAGPGKYLGVASCANSGCHGSTQPLNASRVLQNEYYTWLNNDRHAQAYNILFNARSARIVKNMRLRDKAYREKICLDCHSTNVTGEKVGGHIDLEDGVQCEACHGPASGWRDEHTQAGWKHEQSVERGMRDLRAPSTRADECLVCHLSDRTREVDHELIASGHPILAFELDNYTETMPPHWHWNETHGVRAFATGQIVAFRDSLDNLARHARGAKWPEFSDMSCYNCHHGLKTSGWRQERGWPDRAGLPAWSPQHWVVLRMIVSRAAPSQRAQLDDLVQQLSLKVARMNDPAGVAQAADDARRIASGIIPSVDRMSWSDSDIRSFMAALSDDQDFIRKSDVHSAEQVALTLQSLGSALTRRNSRLVRSPMTKAIDALFDELQNRDDYEPSRFAQKLAAVKATL